MYQLLSCFSFISVIHLFVICFCYSDVVPVDVYVDKSDVSSCPSMQQSRTLSAGYCTAGSL